MSVNPATSTRRALSFADIGDVMPEVKRLARGHRTLGRWTLGQICHHLAAGFVGAMEGFDLRNHRIKRFFLKKQMLNVALTKGIPLNYTVDPKLTPPETSLDEGVAMLASAIERYVSYDGRLHAHPLFGRMSREVWDRVQCVHCAHHLSFVLPVDGL